ncbi:MAG: hypothetical protein ACREHD_33260 [Pirellulales bacterium]
MVPLIEKLRRKLANQAEVAQQARLYLDFIAEDTTAAHAKELLKQAMLEIFWYAPLFTEAVFLAVGRMPKSHPALMKHVAHIALVEANHFEIAYRDYLRLGGDGDWARSVRISPASFMVGAVAKRLAEHEEAFSILGAMYLIEGIAPDLNRKVQATIAAKLGEPATTGEASEFVRLHAEEDVAHTLHMEKAIEDVALAFPSSASAIEYGLDCFSLVYPLPVWHGAWVRAESFRKGVG